LSAQIPSGGKLFASDIPSSTDRNVSMKFIVCLTMLALSSFSFADEFVIGPRFGHQNLKLHSKGGEYISFSSASFSPTGPIEIEYDVEKLDESSKPDFSNSTVQGIRLGYMIGTLGFFSDLDFSRHYFSQSQLDVLGLSTFFQYVFFDVSNLHFHSNIGLRVNQLNVKIYEPRNEYSYESISISSEVEVKPTHVLNYDLGLGITMPLGEKVLLSLDARYSDTLSKGTSKFESKTTVSNTTDTAVANFSTKSKNVTATTQEMTLSLIFSL
jgi:hypothetical protein